MNQLLIQYSYLQVLDIMTTLAFLLHGIQEGNPLVRFAMKFTSNPLAGLVLMKCLALALGIYCWQRGRQRLLSRINIMVAVVVAWNLAALIVGGMGVA